MGLGATTAPRGAVLRVPAHFASGIGRCLGLSLSSGGGPTICVQAPDPTPLQLVDAHPSLSVASAPLRDCRTTQTKPHSERPGSSGARALAIQGPNCGQASDSPEPTAWQARPGPPGGTLGGAPAKALSWGVDGLLARPVSSSH